MHAIHLPHPRVVHRAACLAALWCALILPPADLAHPARVQGAPANTITVNTLDDVFDNSVCSLRAAIISANANGATNACTAGTPGADTINFTLPISCRVIGVQCIMQWKATPPAITEDLTINGSGVGVDGANSFSVFGVRNSVVTFNNMLIRNGNAVYGGGGITMTNSTLTLNRVTLSGNHAYGGAGLYFNSGAVYIHQSQFQNNNSDGYGAAIGMVGGFVVVDNSTFINNNSVTGGAIAGLGNANIDVSSSVFERNSATAHGGALYLQDHNVRTRIAGSVITDNLTTNIGVSSNGGGVYVSSGSLLITGTTIANNATGGRGGGVHVFGAVVTMTNVTVSGNSARDHGGGIFALSDNPLFAPLSLLADNVTLTNNLADSNLDGSGDGGGIFVLSGPVTVTNSIMAGNFDTPNNSGAGTKHPDCSGTYATGRYTLIGRNDGCTGFVHGANGNKVGTSGSPLDPLLAPLANNGGPRAGLNSLQVVPTHALLSLSPAINGGDPAAPGSGGFACEAVDQRNVKRPLGANCDMGAFEAGGFVWLPVLLR
jgi:CSLREA domain-containing protein